MKQRVLLTGASSAVGKAAAAALLQAGHQVVALSRTAPGKAEAATGGLHHVMGDILDHGSLRGLIAGADVVCHLAALVPPRFDDAAFAGACFEANSLATLNIATIASELGKKIVYSSSGSIYVPSAAPSVEASPVFPAARAPYYLGSKLLGEIFVEHLRLSRGLAGVTFRIGSIYGPGVMKSLVTGFVSNAMEGKPLTVFHGGGSCADFVYIGDLARLIAAAVEGPQSGIFNAGSGVATSVRDLAETVCEVFAEYGPVIAQAQPEGVSPASFAALSMDHTNKAFSHTPTQLRTGLQLLKETLAGKNASRT